jgi:mannose-binding lectin 1
MRSILNLLLASGLAMALDVIKDASFGHESQLSPNTYSIPNWHISGKDGTPQIMSNKVILTPPYPGNTQGAMWTDNRVTANDWQVDFEFRATGPEHGGGNLNLWYTKEGQREIGTNSMYTIGKFEGLVVTIDMQGGRSGGIRAFLNDGTIDFKNHHHRESLAFGHCDYSYRNLGRPSHVEMKQDSTGFYIKVDEKLCFHSAKVLLPSNNYFGITAASTDAPDSFEVFKFVTRTGSTGTQQTREEPKHRAAPVPDSRRENVYTAQQLADAAAETFKTQQEQFADLHNRMQVMGHMIDNILAEFKKTSGKIVEKQEELTRMVAASERKRLLEVKIGDLEASVNELRREVGMKDYTKAFEGLHATLAKGHENILEGLPEKMGHGKLFFQRVFGSTWSSCKARC